MGGIPPARLAHMLHLPLCFLTPLEVVTAFTARLCIPFWVPFFEIPVPGILGNSSRNPEKKGIPFHIPFFQWSKKRNSCKRNMVPAKNKSGSFPTVPPKNVTNPQHEDQK
jgi:hypothetical protein